MRSVCFIIIGLMVYGFRADTPANPMDEHHALSTGLIAYYPFNGNASDVSGNNRHGTLRNDCSFISVHNDSALRVVGKNAQVSNSGGYVSIPTIDTTNLRALTISLWVKEDILYLPEAGETYIIFSSDVRLGWCGIGHLYGRLEFAVGANHDDQNPLAVAPLVIPFDPADELLSRVV